jgi:hypothetical protein
LVFGAVDAFFADGFFTTDFAASFFSAAFCADLFAAGFLAADFFAGAAGFVLGFAEAPVARCLAGRSTAALVACFLAGFRAVAFFLVAAMPAYLMTVRGRPLEPTS